METIIRLVKQIVAIGVILFTITLFNYASIKNGSPVKWLAQIDILNRIAMRPNIYDIKDMFLNATERVSTDFIVIHHDEICDTGYTPIAEIKNYHVAKFGQIAYHYLIASEGKTYNMQKNNAALPHAVGYNANSVAICLHGNFDVQQIAKVQLHELAKVVAMLQKEFPNAKILLHSDISDKTCPGINFSLQALNSLLNQPHFLLWN